MKKLIFINLLAIFLVQGCVVNENKRENQKNEEKIETFKKPIPGTVGFAKFSGTQVEVIDFSKAALTKGKSFKKIINEKWSVTFDYPFIYVYHKNHTTKFLIIAYKKYPKELYHYSLRNTEDGTEWLMQWKYYGVNIYFDSDDNEGPYIFLLNKGENIKLRLN